MASKCVIKHLLLVILMDGCIVQVENYKQKVAAQCIIQDAFY